MPQSMARSLGDRSAGARHDRLPGDQGGPRARRYCERYRVAGGRGLAYQDGRCGRARRRRVCRGQPLAADDRLSSCVRRRPAELPCQAGCQNFPSYWRCPFGSSARAWWPRLAGWPARRSLVPSLWRATRSSAWVPGNRRGLVCGWMISIRRLGRWGKFFGAVSALSEAWRACPLLCKSHQRLTNLPSAVCGRGVGGEGNGRDFHDPGELEKS